MIGGIRSWQKTSRQRVIRVAQAWLGHRVSVRARVNGFLDEAVKAGELLEDCDGLLTLPQGSDALAFHVEISDEEAEESQATLTEPHP